MARRGEKFTVLDEPSPSLSASLPTRKLARAPHLTRSASVNDASIGDKATDNNATTIIAIKVDHVNHNDTIATDSETQPLCPAVRPRRLKILDV